MTAERDSIVEIGTCGNTVCGKVLRVLKMSSDGKPPIDSNNPDPALRGRLVEGTMILTGFTDGGALWNVCHRHRLVAAPECAVATERERA